MKTFLAVSLAIVGHYAALEAVGAHKADASELPIYRAELNLFHIDQRLPFDTKQIHSGEVRVDLRKNTVRVNLYRKSSCPPNLICSAILPVPISFELPIEERTTDMCGAIVTRASDVTEGRQKFSESLTVRDNSQNRCPSPREMHATEVVYETSIISIDGSADPDITYSEFMGKRLQPITE